MILAANALTPVQAAEIRHEGGLFWGVQYHPEFSLTQTATIMRRLADLMTAEGFTRTPEEAQAYADDLIAIDSDPARRDLAWRHGLDAEVLDEARRLTEIRNWIESRVKPLKSVRSRA